MIHLHIAKIITREGGYVNHPNDRGGPTNMGITLKTLQDHRGSEVIAEDVEKLTRVEAMQIYTRNYWQAPDFASLERSVMVEDMLFDAAVLHGPGTAIRMLQNAVQLDPDGVIGPVTRSAVDTLTEADLAARFMANRVAFLGALITRDPSQAVFAHGWMNRMRGFIRQIPLL